MSCGSLRGGQCLPFVEEDFKALTGGVGLRPSGFLPGSVWGATRPGGCYVGRGLSSSLPCILSWTLSEISTGGELGGGVRVL